MYDTPFDPEDIPAELRDCFEEVQVQCGAPWIREVRKERVATRPGVGSKVYLAPPVHPDSPVMTHSGDVCGNRDPKRHTTRYVHAGWKPGCRCGIEATEPATVLDPFGGSGTTVLVAESLGRVGIATELSPGYCLMARRRVLRPHARHAPTRDEVPFTLKGLS